MTVPLSAQYIAPLRELIARDLGLHFPPDRSADLRRGVAAAARDLGYSDSDACARGLLSQPLNPSQRDALARHLTVGETYFFRDKAAFRAIETHVLPELVRSRRGRDQHLRIWSAACCSGEEAYSLAICVRRALPDLAKWRVTILGTDLNPLFLQKASAGVFGEWSFRDTPPSLREHYFRKTDEGHWEIIPDVRRMVDFFPLNLAADVYPSVELGTQAMDLILCRNVLIYFNEDGATRVIHDLGRCLSESGWLVLGPNEVPHAPTAELTPVMFPGAVLHRKTPAAQRVLPPPAPASVVKPASGHEVPWPPKSDPPPPSVDALAEPSDNAARPHDGLPISVESAQVKSPTPPASITDVRALANEGKLTAALVVCDHVLTDDKTNHVAHFLRAGILQELGDLSEARAALKRTLYLDPDFILAHFALGNLARTRGDHSAADRHLTNALTLARARPSDAILPESDGLTAGRLVEMIVSLRAVHVIA